MSIIWLISCGLVLLQQPAVDVAPLPELQPFLSEIRRNLHSDRTLLSQYTFTQTETERHLDKDGSVRKTEVTVSEIYPSLVEELTYRRVISRDGKPLSPEELLKQDRDHDKKMEKQRRKLEHEGQDERQRRLASEAQEKKREEEIIDEAFRLYSINMVGRELRGSASAILLTFRPKPEYKPHTREAKLLKKMAGKAWFTEDTHELVRIEMDLVDDFSLGFGVLARLQKGAKGIFERRLVNGEVWLPASASFTGKGRLLLIKNIQIDAVQEFSDYRKYTVDTNVTFPEIGVRP